MSARCQEWLPRKNRQCAAPALPHVAYCGNHKPSDVEPRVPCPVDPSHTILESEVRGHAMRCPGLVQIRRMEQMPYYRKGANAGSDTELEDGMDEDARDKANTNEMGHLSSQSKRTMFNSLSREELKELVEKIESAYNLHCRDKFELTTEHPAACEEWLNADMDRRIPFQEKHVVQQASMLGNMESFGLLQSHVPCTTGKPKALSKSNSDPVYVEFGAGRGYLAHMLADCYKAQNIVLVERRSYKFKADRTLRQNAAVVFERVRIDIENLDLDGVKPLQDCHFVALSKHLCGHATDLTLRCCRPDLTLQSPVRHLDGIAIATCCHHICQWKPYVNKEFFKQMGFTKKEFHILTWLTSGAVSGLKEHPADEESHSAGDSLGSERGLSAWQSRITAEDLDEEKSGKVEDASDWLACPAYRAELGLKCKKLLDVGRLYWLMQMGMKAKLVAYVSPEITPENTLLLASHAMAGQD
eukprot:c10490_g1_i1 orf=110-1522(+)